MGLVGPHRILAAGLRTLSLCRKVIKPVILSKPQKARELFLQRGPEFGIAVGAKGRPIES